jgi:DNA-binding NarL/FixJ family response regulator
VGERDPAVRDLLPDVVLMDVLMDGMDGVAATTAIRRDLPATEVLALSNAMDRKWIVGMIQAGAIGYLAKDVTTDDLCRAIRAVSSGEIQLAPEAMKYLLQETRTPAMTETLTRRETEVLRRLVMGESNKQIAHSLRVGEKTVKTHVSSIMGKMGVQSRTQAALLAVHYGLIHLRETPLAS